MDALDGRGRGVHRQERHREAEGRDDREAVRVLSLDQYSYRRLLTLAWPLILGTAANSAMLFTDRIFLSRLGPEALAAGFPAGISAYFAACFFQAAAQYVATFAAQHEGAGERDETGRWAWQGLVIAVIAGLVNAALIPFLPAIFALMHADPPVHAAIVTLASILFANALPVCVIAAVGGYFAGTGRTRTVLAINASLLALNAWLNWCLIFGHCGLPRLGLAGSALGTLIATCCIAAVALALLLRARERRERGTWPPALSAARFARFCRFALPQGARQLVDISGWEFFAFAVGSFGTVALAANNIVITWNLLTFIPMIGLSQAIGVAVGQSLGAGGVEAARAAGRRGLVLQLGYGLTIGALYLALMDPMIAVFLGSESPELRAELVAVARSLFVVAALWNVGDALNMAFSGALGGAGDTRWPFAAGACCTVLLLVIPLAVLLRLPAERLAEWHVQRITAAWLVTLLYVTVFGTVLALRYRAGAWQRMSVRGGG